MTTDLETAAQRWARWKATRSSSPPGRRAVTITEQRRLAQRESVKARKRNAAENRRREMERMKAAREEAQALEQFGMRRIERRFPTELLWLRSERGGVWCNENACALACAILGRMFEWVRRGSSSCEWKTSDFQPAKATWASDPDRIVLAISVDRVYYLRSHDFLSHFERKRDGHPYLPGGAVSWKAVLAGTCVRMLRGLPIPAPRDVAHAIVSRWEELGGDFELPWDEEFLSATADQTTLLPSKPRRVRGETPPPARALPTLFGKRRNGK